MCPEDAARNRIDTPEKDRHRGDHQDREVDQLNLIASPSVVGYGRRMSQMVSASEDLPVFYYGLGPLQRWVKKRRKQMPPPQRVHNAPTSASPGSSRLSPARNGAAPASAGTPGRSPAPRAPFVATPLNVDGASYPANVLYQARLDAQVGLKFLSLARALPWDDLIAANRTILVTTPADRLHGGGMRDAVRAEGRMHVGRFSDERSDVGDC
jgi:hypothetical protein